VRKLVCRLYTEAAAVMLGALGDKLAYSLYPIVATRLSVLWSKVPGKPRTAKAAWAVKSRRLGSRDLSRSKAFREAENIFGSDAW
jgi:hypothetical protein